jgi:hypothetical protein
MDGERVRRIAAWTVAVLVIAGAIGWFATALRGSNLESASSSAPSAGSTGSFGAATPAAPDRSGAEGGVTLGGLVGGSDVPQAGPKIVKQADLRLQVRKGTFLDRFQQAISTAGSFGGFVQSSDTTVGRFRTGMLTIRVPADRFEAALAQLRRLGTVKASKVAGQDVTSAYVDLQARLTNWQAQEGVLLRLMSKATTIVDSIKVQQQLERVQGNVEELQGQLRLIGDQTAMATISVGMSEAGPVVPLPAKRAAVVRAWHDAVTGFVNVLSAVIVGLGYLVPLGLLGLVLWLGWRGVTRARRRPGTATAVS